MNHYMLLFIFILFVLGVIMTCCSKTTTSTNDSRHHYFSEHFVSGEGGTRLTAIKNPNLYFFNENGISTTATGNKVRLHFLSQNGSITCSSLGIKKYKFQNLLDSETGNLILQKDFLTTVFIPDMTVTKIILVRPTNVQINSNGNRMVSSVTNVFTNVKNGLFNKETGLLSFDVKDLDDTSPICLQDNVTMAEIPKGMQIKDYALDITIEGVVTTTTNS